MTASPYTQMIPSSFIAAIVIWVSGIVGLLFFVDQSSFPAIAGFYALAFASYGYMMWKYPFGNPYDILLYTAIIIRLVAIFAFPSLSDDIYRFIWDGRLAIAGYHPFEHLPSHYLQVGNEVPGLTESLYNKLNSQNYYTIYPTISQWVFNISAWIAPDSIYGFSLSMKGMLAAMDIGSILLARQILKSMSLSMNRAMYYALNPLVIIEIVGNGHFEGGMIFFTMLAIYLFLKNRYFFSAIALSAAVASKMLPLMFLPLLLAIIPWRKAFRYYAYTAIGLTLFFAPMMSATFINHISESLNLYFQKFEFNGSIYYLIRWIGYQVKGWNIIGDAGPILALIVFVGIWILTFFNRKSKATDWPRLAMWALTIYFLMATIVHPWYISTLVALCVFSHYRFPLLWSGLITMTYINYSYDPFYENLWIVGLEYLLVFGMLIFELKNHNFSRYGMDQSPNRNAIS